VTNINLSVSDLNTEGSEAAEHGRERGSAGGLADNEMALETDTVDGSTGTLDDVHNLDGTVSLSLAILKVVVVVVPVRVLSVN
jgi:hypothetical protein